MLPVDHIHTFRRIKGLKKKTYLCTHPECEYTRIREKLLGKQAACPFCKSPFILTPGQLNNALPRCPECRRGKESGEPFVKDFLQEMLGGGGDGA